MAAKRLCQSRQIWTQRSAQSERTLYTQKDFRITCRMSLIEAGEERETPSELLKEKSREEKENDGKELTRFVNHWNAVCTECNEPTLAWLPSDVERLAKRLVEVIRQLRIPEMPDEKLSKHLRLLCGERSGSVFGELGPRFLSYNPTDS